MTGVELRARRKALGLSQGRLAKRLGVSSNTVARWERGELTIGRPEMVGMSLDQIAREVSKVPIWTTWGPVRGCCDHAHKSPEAAARCRDRDARACHSQSAADRCYSDREVRVVANLADLRSYGTIRGPGRPLPIEE